MPTHQFCDHVINADSVSSGHEHLRSLKPIHDFLSQPGLLAQSRSGKPWLLGRKPVIYVEAPSEIKDPDLCRGILDVTQSPDGLRCSWLIDSTLLDSDQTDLPDNVVPVVRVDPETSPLGTWYQDYDVPFQHPVVLRLHYGLLQILKFRIPNDWLIVEVDTPSPGEREIPSKLEEELRRAKDDIEDFPQPCPVFFNNAPHLLHEVPDWIPREQQGEATQRPVSPEVER